MTIPVQSLADQFAAAVEAAEVLWTRLKADKAHPSHAENSRLLIRFRRALRRCDRLRMELKTRVETGKL